MASEKVKKHPAKLCLEFGAHRADVVLSILPFTLTLASLDKHKLDETAAKLLRLFMLDIPPCAKHDDGDRRRRPKKTEPEKPTKSRPRLLNFTETENEISILIDEQSLQEFGTKDLDLSPGKWKAIQIHEGPTLIEQTGVVAALAGPLAAEGYEILYLSTLESDIILVKEDQILGAYHCLESHLKIQPVEDVASKMKGLSLEETKSDATGDKPSETDALNGSAGSNGAGTKLNGDKNGTDMNENGAGTKLNGDKNGIDMNEKGASNGSGTNTNDVNGTGASTNQPYGIHKVSRTPKMNVVESIALPSAEPTLFQLSPLEYDLRLIQFKKSDIHHCAFHLLKLFLSHERNRFFSFTEVDSQLSLIVQRKWLDSFPSDVVTANENCWRALHVSGFNPTGLVGPVSMKLARRNVCIYYLSTYHSDYTLVLDEQVRDAASISQVKNHR